MACFPFMIEMNDRECVIFGGGEVAKRKAEQMLLFGAKVKMIAPETVDISDLLKNENFIYIDKCAEKKDVEAAFVVVMATNNSELNTEFSQYCRSKGILVNVVDVKKDCDFYFPAIIKQGEVVIAVSTGGSSPLLAGRIKRDINENLREDYGRIAREMADRRDTIIEKTPPAERKNIFCEELEKKLNEHIIKVGTRGSKLAIIQTDMVIERLKEKFPEYDFEKVIINTKGDKQKERAISEFGGKAVFVEEFERALLGGEIDLAVHSSKDMPNPCMDGLVIAGALTRGCPNDVLIYKKGRDIFSKEKFFVGTGSLRRQAQIKEIYDNCECKPLRGNVGTRLEKLRKGEYDAIILAEAGITRLGLDAEADLEYRAFSIDEMVPAAGQGIIAIEARVDSGIAKMAMEISDKDSQFVLELERYVLMKLGAGCHEPVGVYAEIPDEGSSEDEEEADVENNVDNNADKESRAAGENSADNERKATGEDNAENEKIKVTIMQEFDGSVVKKSAIGNRNNWLETIDSIL